MLECGSNGSTAAEVLTQINDNVDAIAAQEGRITTNEGDITQAQADIISNANAINNVDAAVVALADRVALLEALGLFEPSYVYTKEIDILDIDEAPTWTPLVSVTDAGAVINATYEMKFSVNGALADTNDSSMVRYRVNGGDWTILRQEAKDVTDIFGLAYLFPIVATGTVLTLDVEAAKDPGGTTFDVAYANAIIERKTA